jgi:hypothetical protein
VTVRQDRELDVANGGARALLEAARRLAPGPFDPDDLDQVIGFLSISELERLDAAAEAAAGGDEAALAAAWADAQRRATARALVGVTGEAANRAERASQRILALANPTKPDDPLSTVYATAREDQVERGLWWLDPMMVRQTPGLPRSLSQAEVDACTRMAPWPH